MQFYLYRDVLEEAMNNEAVKAYVVQQVKLPPKKSISACVRKLLVFCVGRRSTLTKELYFAT